MKLMVSIGCIIAFSLVVIPFLHGNEEVVSQLAVEKNDYERFVDAGYFLQSASLSSLQQTYKSNEKIKILLVAGHTDTSPGALYKDLREVELNFAFIDELYRKMKDKDWIDVEVVGLRSEDQNAYKDFFAENGPEIEVYEKYQKSITEEMRSLFLIDEQEEGNHVTARRDIAVQLYGVNYYANQNDFDLVVHIHFNDHPRKDHSEPGKHTGYAIYIPDDLYSSTKASREIAKSVARELSEFYATSTHPLEKEGVIESQELIAAGAHNTLRTPVLLMEYAYIYEDWIQNIETRNKMFDTLSDATIRGIEKSVMTLVEN